MSVYAIHAMLALTIFIALCAFVFLCWMLCIAFSGFRNWLDDRRVLKSRRIRNANLDASYRTGQFMVPKQFRDFK